MTVSCRNEDAAMVARMVGKISAWAGSTASAVEMGERVDQRFAPIAPEPLGQVRLVLAREHLGELEDSLALAREAERVRAAVGAGGQALGQAAPFQPVQQAHQPRAL